MFRVHFAKLCKIDLESTVRSLPIFPESICQIQYTIYNSYEVYYHPQKIREIRDALGKQLHFPTMSLYFNPSPLKIRAFPPYKIYVFRMSKTWATYC